MHHQEQVRHVMVEAVMSIGINEPVSEALRLFTEYPVHRLPVVGDTQLKGMLSSADMLKLEYFLPKGGAKASVAVLNDRFRIEKLMRSPVITVRPDETIEEAASRMVVHAVHALPVVDDGNHLPGYGHDVLDIMHALLHGIGTKHGTGGAGPIRQPTELEMRRALEAAQAATLAGTDTDGIAAAMLYLRERNALLESLREDVARYVHAGQDEHLHSRLLKGLDRLGQASPEVII